MFDIHVDDRPLRKLQENLKTLERGKNVPIQEILSPDFMATHTSFPDLESFLEASGIFPVDADSEALSKLIDQKRAELDAWTADQSAHGTWDELIGAGGREYVQREMFRGL